MVITLTVILPQLTPIKNLNFLEIKLFQFFGYFFLFSVYKQNSSSTDVMDMRCVALKKTSWM